MSIEKVREHLAKHGLEDKILEFEISSATVELAAKAVGCDGKQIAKTMSFIVEDKPILIVTAGDAKIANSKFKEFFHTKAKMIPFENVEEYIGHAVGGVCPFAVKDNVTVYLDESLKRFDIVYPAAGSSNSAVKLTISELEQASGFDRWIDVCKDWE